MSAHCAALQYAMLRMYCLPISIYVCKSIVHEIVLRALVDVCRTRSIKVPGALKEQHPNSDQPTRSSESCGILICDISCLVDLL